MTKRDPRYDKVRKLIELEVLTTFREIFEFVPKSVVARDLCMNSARFTKLMYHVDRFILKDLFSIAHLIGISEQRILRLVMDQFDKDRPGYQN